MCSSFLQDDPQLVSLHWLLGEVSRQIEQTSSSTSRFIIDIMPNLKFLINNDIFLADCTSDMNGFEQKVSGACWQDGSYEVSSMKV